MANSILLEAACTSFQLHLQVAPDDFARFWNAAQVLSAPLVALAANSPFFLGKQLHHETRIALFEQAADTRTEELASARACARACGSARSWLTEGVFELFDENVRYFPSLLPICDDEDPPGAVRAGDIPHLPELTLHNGTIYRWNRPVYDVARGRPHMRIENRVLPAGPTVIDAVANAAFYYGLLRTLADAEPPAWHDDELRRGRRELLHRCPRRPGRSAVLAAGGQGRARHRAAAAPPHPRGPCGPGRDGVSTPTAPSAT